MSVSEGSWIDRLCRAVPVATLLVGCACFHVANATVTTTQDSDLQTPAQERDSTPVLLLAQAPRDEDDEELLDPVSSLERQLRKFDQREGAPLDFEGAGAEKSKGQTAREELEALLGKLEQYEDTDSSTNNTNTANSSNRSTDETQSQESTERGSPSVKLGLPTSFTNQGANRATPMARSDVASDQIGKPSSSGTPINTPSSAGQASNAINRASSAGSSSQNNRSGTAPSGQSLSSQLRAFDGKLSEHAQQTAAARARTGNLEAVPMPSLPVPAQPTPVPPYQQAQQPTAQQQTGGNQQMGGNQQSVPPSVASSEAQELGGRGSGDGSHTREPVFDRSLEDSVAKALREAYELEEDPTLKVELLKQYENYMSSLEARR